MMQDMDKRLRRYWEGDNYTYDNKIIRELESSRQFVWRDLILKNGPKKPCLDILDASCGTGLFPIILSRAGHHVTGIDVTDDMLVNARRNIEREGAEAELLLMDPQELAFPDESFDMVVSRNLTWTLDDPEKAYAEWKRVLRPGGVVLVFDACWFRWMFDQELEKQYRENDALLRRKYRRGTHDYNDIEEDTSIERSLFMSDKIRPQWDLEVMQKLGYSETFADTGVYEKAWSDFEKELYATSPLFLVGGVR